ncbi:RDD family protein [Anaerobacillus sp. CMMVII]|uniref:RDD family protein n=1 Tax=Anaerobacillus sp. CMMVII TaxID=2755588 RepID=UPI0021B7EFD3|nr:RDD family protein [Anaerobacillus sp. CMMVII]MCT8137368.1 RDD family protein [Anaerobacillus sp. CMMVII]
MDKFSSEDERKLKEHSISYRYAGFWMRFWAYLLDLVVVASINRILIAPFLVFANIQGIEIGFISLEMLIMSIVTFLYFLVLTKNWGQTIGKRVFGLKVISNTAQPLTWSAVLFREVIGRYILQAFTLTYILYIIVPFQKKKQGLHDMIGDTYVVHEEIIM